MALSKQLIGFNFSNGLSTEADATMSAPGTLEKAENVRYLESGALVGREGFVNLGSRETLAGGSIDTGYVNAKRQNEYLVADGDNLYSRPSLTGVTDELSDCGIYRPCEFSNKFVKMPKGKKHGNAHYATANGVDVFVYSEYDASDITNYSVIVDVLDSETGHFYVQRHAVVNVAREADRTKTQRLYKHPQPQCITVGAYIFIFYYDGSQYVRYTTINTTPISTGTAVSLSNLTPAAVAGSVAGTILPRTGGANVEPSDDNSGTEFHPVFSVAAVNNASISNGFAIAYSVDEDTGRVVTYTQSSGTATASASIDFTPKKDSADANTTFLFAPLASTPVHGITSGFQLVALNDNTSSATSYQYFVFYTKNNDAGNGPDVTFNAFKANLASTEYPITTGTRQAAVVEDAFLITASAKTATDDGDVYIVLETTKAHRRAPNVTKPSPASSEAPHSTIHSVAVDAGALGVNPYYAEHQVQTAFFTRGTTNSFATRNLSTFSGSLTSDIFRHDGKLYYAVSHYSAPFEANVNIGTSRTILGVLGANNVMVVYQLQTSTKDVVIAATPTGAAASSYISDFMQRIQQDNGNFSSGFRTVYGIQRVTEVSSGKFRFGANRFVEFESTKAKTTFNDSVRGISLCEINFNTTKLPQHVENQNTTILTGGFNHVYDGSLVFENEFFTAPVILDAFVQETSGLGTLGDSSSATTYRYVAVYEFVDAQGNVYRSAPSNEAEVSISTSQYSSDTYRSITLGLGGWTPSRTNGRNRIAIYRTSPLSTAVESRTVFRRLCTLIPDLDSSMTAFNDSGTMDAQLLFAEILYTSGFQPNGNIGSTKDIVLHRNRMFAVSAEDIIFASQPLEIETALRFVIASPNYIVPITNEKANIAAIGSNLEHLIVFTTRNGYAIAGDGPDATGNGLFSRPRKFAPGIGARADAASKLTPMGFMVQTGSGIVSVDKTLQVVSIGAPITKTLQTQEKGLHRNETVIYTHLKSIAVNSKTKEIYLGFENMDNVSDPGTNGLDDEFICVFNYGVKQWTTFKLRLAEGASNQGLVVINGDLFRLDSNGHSSKMQSTQYVTGTATNTTGVYTDTHDASTRAFTKVIKTNFIKFGGPQEQFRLYRIGILGDYTAASTIAVTLYKDYRTSGDALTSTEITSDANPYHLRAHVDDQKCQAVSVEITITNSATSTDDLELSSLVFEVGKRSSRLKLPATQTLVNS